jgi:hypothetical protein
VACTLMNEIINSRLFTTVRDALGLTYDVSFELSMFERLPTGWFVLSVTSVPQKIDDALAASLRTLRGLATQQVNQRELDRARRTLLMRNDSDLRDNSHWLELLSHIQSPVVPAKGLNCVSDLTAMYEAATVEDIYQAYGGLEMDDGSIFSCVGSSGQTMPPLPATAPAMNPGAAAAAMGAAKLDGDMAANAALAAAAVMKAFKSAGIDFPQPGGKDKNDGTQ